MNQFSSNMLFIEVVFLTIFRTFCTAQVSESFLPQAGSNESTLNSPYKNAFNCGASKCPFFEARFEDDQIDKNKWFIEEYIPYFLSADFEFVSYRPKPDILFIKNNRLFIKPKPVLEEQDVRGELDLRNNCTKTSEEECYYKQQLSFILPPVTSARIVSHKNFKYGKFEIKAKLPVGDWIYPQIYLQQTLGMNKKLWIAYSRGNVHLYTTNGEDIGGHWLFSGPVLSATEPARSSYLKSVNSSQPFSSQTHVYTVIWARDMMSFLLDGTEYGRIDSDEMNRINFAKDRVVRLVLGVGVGGVNDFPDNVRSGDDVKPWKNKERDQLKKFFNARDKWLKSWSDDETALQIEYVKVTAL